MANTRTRSRARTTVLRRFPQALNPARRWEELISDVARYLGCLSQSSAASLNMEIAAEEILMLLRVVHSLASCALWSSIDRLEGGMPWDVIPEHDMDILASKIQSMRDQLRSDTVKNADLWQGMDLLYDAIYSMNMMFECGAVDREEIADINEDERYQCAALLSPLSMRLNRDWLRLRTESTQHSENL